MQVLLPDWRVPKTHPTSSQLRPAANINRLMFIVATTALLAALRYWYIGGKYCILLRVLMSLLHNIDIL